jgi:Domain of unknown function (DUF4390)
MLLGGLLAASTARADEPGITVLTAGAARVGEQYLLNARIEYRLGEATLKALQNGVPITFEVQADLAAQRDWWPDERVSRLRQDIVLTYEPLSRTYVVTDPVRNTRQTFTTRYAALQALGSVSDVPLVPVNDLAAGTNYDVIVRVTLDRQRLPGPLRLLSLLDTELRLVSDDYRWTLAR